MSQKYLGGVITANPTTPTLSAATGVWTMEQQFQNIANWPKSTGLISRSVRIRQSASAYLNRTPASATNRKTWTWSGWVKIGKAASTGLFTASTSGSNMYTIQLGLDGTLNVYAYTGTYPYFRVTSAVFRDYSAWYHFVVAFDSTQATDTNRIKIYANGILQSTTSGSGSGWPTLNYEGGVNNTINHQFSDNVGGTSYFDGYLTEINFIDGQALTPSYFGFTDGNGVWQPATYSGTYGTNGFYLNFSDNSAATATTIGKDYSGNGNNWTPNNISVTAGVTYDSMLDVPTPYADGGNGRGNYCTLNPLDKNWWVAAVTTQSTISNANLTASCGAVDTKVSSTMSVLGGKFYAEVTVTSVQISNIIVSGYAPSTFEIAYINDGNKSINRTQSAYGASYTAGDIIGIAVDAPNNQVTFYKNGTSQGAITNTFIGDAIFIGLYLYNSNFSINFGQRPFSYTPPTGYVALNTQNLSTPTISNGATVMAATLWTGDGTNPRTITNTVNGVSFKPDLVWTKARSVAYDNSLYDSVRGATNYLISNSTAAEASAANSLQAFNSNGFQVGGNNYTNSGSVTYVGWQWQAGQGSTSSNTNGSITSTVSVNTTAGFSVVTYTGNGSTGTVGHGLGVAPKMLIVKKRNSATSSNWMVWHTSIGTGFVLNLNGTAASGSTYWNNTAPTSTVFSLDSNANYNSNTDTFVAYCWAAVAGYSAFGSYTGNGSADGPFVYLGFRPRWVMIRNPAIVANWLIFDSSRETYNQEVLFLFANTADAEQNSSATVALDFVSNGFKIRQTSGNINASGNSLIYAAFAENPFNISRAR